MNRSKSALASGVFVLTVAGTALAALDNESVGVRKVDAMSPDDIVIHVDRSVSVPDCAGSNTMQIACDLDDRYCEPAMRTALSAQLSGRRIDFDVSSSECVAGIAKFTRLRNENH
jgi:hypothetical protein